MASENSLALSIAVAMACARPPWPPFCSHICVKPSQEYFHEILRTGSFCVRRTPTPCRCIQGSRVSEKFAFRDAWTPQSLRMAATARGDGLVEHVWGEMKVRVGAHWSGAVFRE